jgi:ankyrin repeat protein
VSIDNDLAEAMEVGDFNVVQRIVQEHPKIVNSTDWTPPPLHCCVLWGQPKIAALLLDNGADIEIRDPDRQTTALRYAIVYCKKDRIPVLLDRGANPAAIVDNGTTALEMASEAAGGSMEEYDELPSREEYSKIVELLKQLGLE